MRSTPPLRDQVRFRALYDANYASVLRFVQRRAPDPDRGEDLAHETFLVAWRRIRDAPSRDEDARAWLFGVARYCLLAEHKARSRRIALGIRLSSEISNTPDHGHDVFAIAELARAWNKLDATEQETLSLAFWDDVTSADAAQILGISIGAYRTRLNRARTRLRAHLDTTTPTAPNYDSARTCS